MFQMNKFRLNYMHDLRNEIKNVTIAVYCRNRLLLATNLRNILTRSRDEYIFLQLMLEYRYNIGSFSNRT